jgi:murein L,D-transpeptidase YcbB/YkuD
VSVGYTKMRQVFCILAAMMMIFGGSAAAQVASKNDAVQEAVVSIVEHISGGQPYQLEGATMAAVKTIPEFYARRDFRPAWTNRKSTDDLLTAIRHIDEEGLDSRDYHLRAIERLKGQTKENSNPVLRAELDVLLTDALTRLGYHLLFGKVDPTTFDRNWNLGRWIDEPDAATAIQRVIDSPSLAASIAALRPRHFYYQRLKNGLAHYRMIAARGGWVTIPAGPTLKPGMHHSRVAALRLRLGTTGDLTSGATDDPQFYDDNTAWMPTVSLGARLAPRSMYRSGRGSIRSA